MWDFKLLKDLLYNFQQIKRRLKSEPLEILTNFLLLPLQIPNVVYGWSQVIKKGPLVQFPTKKMSKVGTIGFLMVWKLFETGEIFYIRSGPPRLARPFFLVQSIGNFDQFFTPPPRECVKNLDLRVQVHPGDLWVPKQRVHIVLEASKSAGAKGDVPKICGFVHPLHPL